MTSETTEARELLLRAVSPIPGDLAVVFDCLVAARRAASLYQEDHPIAMTARDEACLALETALRERGKLNLTATEAGLLIDDQAHRQTADTNALAKRLRQHGILSITFRAAVDPTELSVLLAAMDLPAARLRARGGVHQILLASGVTGIEVEDLCFTDEVPVAEQAITAQFLEANWDALIAELAEILCAGTDDVDEETYDKLLQVLADPALVVRLLTECLTGAAAQAAEGGRSAFVGQIVQRLERIILARSSAEWEKVKANVRAAVAKLPPAVRPRIFAFHADHTGQGPPSPDEVVASPANERLPGVLRELAAALAEARNLPRELADAFVGTERGDQAMHLLGADAHRPASRLAMILNGIAAIKFEPLSPWEEMTDLLQSARGQTTLADAVTTLLEVLDKETKLDGYSKVATELERKTRELMDRNQRAAALCALASLARHANESGDYPAWQRLRARAALEAIGTDAILHFAGQMIRAATPDQAETATDLLVFLGEAAAPMLTQLIAEPLMPGADTAVMEALVRLRDQAVPELCRALHGGYTQTGQAVVRVLSRIATPRALEGLGKALGARDVLVRLTAVQALGKTNSPGAARLLLPGVTDHNPSIRRAAIAALGDLRSAEAVPELSRVATAGSAVLGRAVGDQLEAICALGKIAGGQAIQTLTRVLRRRPWFGAARADETRLAAAAALKRIGTPECLDVLASHIKDKRPAVRAACQEMFEEMQADRPRA
jgi:HEAT repeat protein